VTYAPIELDAWRPDPSARQQPRSQLLFVGNDFDRKGGLRLLRLHQEHLADRYDLVIASREDLARQASRGARNVICRSDLDTAGLLEYYQSASALVLPTIQDFSPMVLFEAIGAGLPCIATDITGISDVVRNGQSGCTLPPTASDQDWLAAIERVVGDKDLNETLSQGARALAEEICNRQRFDDLILGTLRELAPERTAADVR
jgi:glycosyltransferase involved in cell wall biosynthesis